MHGFLGGEILTFPDGRAMIRHVRGAVTSGLDETFVLGVGYWIYGQHIRREVYREGAFSCQEVTLSNLH
jgi:hypothetical protein